MRYLVIGCAAWIGFISFLIYADHQRVVRSVEPYTLHRWCKLVSTQHNIAFLECGENELKVIQIK